MNVNNSKKAAEWGSLSALKKKMQTSHHFWHSEFVSAMSLPTSTGPVFERRAFENEGEVSKCAKIFQE